MSEADTRAGPVRCSRCGETFREPRDLSLHRGRVHAGELDEAEQASFELAIEEEKRWLAAFRRHVRAALAGGAVLFTYTVVLLLAYAYRSDPAFMLLPLPGILGFAAVTYYMVYRHQATWTDSST